MLNLHDEWENPSNDPGLNWIDEVGNVYESVTRRGPITYSLNVPPTVYSGATGEPQIKEWNFFSATASAKATLSTNFGADFKLKDWFNTGASFEAESSIEVKSEYASTAIVSLNPGDTALPVVRYFINTKHQLLDRYDVNGRVPNPASNDEKWEHAADLPIRIQDIRPDWVVTPGGNNG